VSAEVTLNLVTRSGCPDSKPYSLRIKRLAIAYILPTSDVKSILVGSSGISFGLLLWMIYYKRLNFFIFSWILTLSKLSKIPFSTDEWLLANIA
jgi:hypothetical protein